MKKQSEFLIQWITLRKEEEKFKLFVKSLSEESIMNLLININRNLRNINSEQEVLKNGVIAGDLVAPTEVVRNNTIKELIQYIKKADNLKDVAVLTYYTIINLHMFDDGNGRTARFLYDLISGEIAETKIMYYFHNANDNNYDGKDDFEKHKGILDISYVNQISNSFLSNELSKYFEQYPELRDKIIECGFGGFYADKQQRIKEFIRGNFKLNLTEQEISDLSQILSDNGGVQYTPSGIGMMIIAIEKGEIDKWIEINKKIIDMYKNDNSIYHIISNRMCFRIKNNIELLSNWTSEDFRKIIELGNYTKQKQLSYMIDIFANPQNYTYDSESSLKDYIMQPEKVNQNKKTF